MWSIDLAGLLRFPLIEYHGAVVTPAQLLVAAIWLGITYFASRLVGRFFQNRLLHIEPGPRYTMGRLSQYAIWALGIAAALKQLDTDLTTFTVVAGALGIGVGFGLQNVVANFVAGFVLLFERPIKVNDRVTTESVEGNVVAINLRSTTIVTNDNIAIIVPNTEFISRTVINWSYGDTRVRIHVPVGVAYGSDLTLVTRTLLEAASTCEGVMRDPAPMVLFKEFGDSSLNFELLVWLDEPAMHFQVQSRVNFAIDAAFRERGISIPFPQRDLHVIPAAGAPPPFPGS